jgi:hypothetical protein
MRKGGVNTQLPSGEQHVISAEKARLKALIKSARQGLELTPVPQGVEEMQRLE